MQAVQVCCFGDSRYFGTNANLRVINVRYKNGWREYIFIGYKEPIPACKVGLWHKLHMLCLYQEMLVFELTFGPKLQ